MRLLIVLFIFLTTIFNNAVGQIKTSNSETAYQLFKAGEYSEAALQYKSLWETSSKDAKLNYYYGACLIEINDNVSQAVKCLKYASIQKVNKDVFFYLGRSYQLLYEFDAAIENYTRYLTLTGTAGGFKTMAEDYISQCKTGKSHSSKIYNLLVLKSDTCTPGNIISYYQPSTEVGRVMKNNDFFESGIDPEGVMFLTERGDNALYSFKRPNATDWDLYRIEKLIDGWSESIALPGEINSSYNELYPFLQTDGVTLYFSSDRPGGLGGYDIYKATYNSQLRKFTDVVNMGIPFNSPRDDYFFVCDDFAHQAWFSSNRYTGSKQLMVYKIQWDNSIVKSQPADNNAVKEAARLLASNQNSSASGSVTSNSESNGKSASNSQTALFHFTVADTLEYTRFEHFKSEYALASFKKGLDMEHQRDSLSLKMKEKRYKYSVSQSDEERNKLVNGILELEKQTYSFDEKIEANYYQAQKTEQDKIRELVRLGKYYSSSDVRIVPNKQFSIDNITFPANLTIYTNDDFGRHLKQLEDMYHKLFPQPEISKLMYADSLYAWGNVLNIESSRMLENASNVATQEQVKMPIPFKTNESNSETELSPESMIKQARQLKLDALKLYHMSLDSKYTIYRNKFRDIKESAHDGEKYEQTMSYAGEAMTYYKAGDELINQSIVGIDLETFEKAGTLKRSAVNSQEKGLLYYIEEIEATPTDSISTGFAAKSYQEIHKGSDTNEQPTQVQTSQVSQENKTPDEIVATALAGQTNSQTQTKQPIYKIQVGVFRNKPDDSVIEKLEDVTSETIAESGLMKYYSGQFNSYEEAVKKVVQVRQLGFEGAFVVAFYEGKQIAVSAARDLQK